MFNLLAGAFMSIASLFGGLFGMHPHNSMASTTPNDMHMASSTPGHMMMGPGVMGVVESISGTTLTVQGMASGMQSATTTYTVDASNAVVVKQKVGTTTVASIAQGDHVVVQGAVTGTSVVAKVILDGMLPAMGHMMPMSGGMGMGSSTHPRPMHTGSSTHDWNPGGPMKPASNS